MKKHQKFREETLFENSDQKRKNISKKRTKKLQPFQSRQAKYKINYQNEEE